MIDAAARVGGIHANDTYSADFLSDNLQIQVNLMDAANAVDVDRLLFLGSSCIYPKFADAADPGGLAAHRRSSSRPMTPTRSRRSRGSCRCRPPESSTDGGGSPRCRPISTAPVTTSTPTTRTCSLP